MWYHYLFIAIGVLIALRQVWTLYRSNYSFGVVGWVLWAMPLVIAIPLLWYGISGVMAPAVPPMYTTPTMGGRRIRRRY